MYDGIAVLKAYGTSTYDEYGNETLPVTETTVFVQPRVDWTAQRDGISLVCEERINE